MYEIFNLSLQCLIQIVHYNSLVSVVFIHFKKSIYLESRFWKKYYISIDNPGVRSNAITATPIKECYYENW